MSSSQLAGRCFPQTIVVHSHHTGRSVKFVQDREAAERNEFWDGEACQYKPVEFVPNVKSLMVYHTY
jgi:hypothetical protein